MYEIDGNFQYWSWYNQYRKIQKKEYAKNKKFYQKIFTNSEIKYCLGFKNSSKHFAGKFAIKEAVKKSIKLHCGFV